LVRARRLGSRRDFRRSPLRFSPSQPCRRGWRPGPVRVRKRFRIRIRSCWRHGERTEEEPELDGRARLRRGMLTAHQIAGQTTLGLMATTVVLGQLNFDDHFSPSGAGSGAYATPHRIAAYSTAAAFALTGGLAWVAPVPYEK